jgi:hypothetical protein
MVGQINEIYVISSVTSVSMWFLWALLQNCKKWQIASSYQTVCSTYQPICLSVLPSSWYNWAPTGRIFMKFDIWVFFENNGYFTWLPMYTFLSYLFQFFLEREMFQTNVVDKIKTHVSCSVTFFRKLCRLWDNVEKTIVGLDRPQITVRRMRISCLITKATNTNW